MYRVLACCYVYAEGQSWISNLTSEIVADMGKACETHMKYFFFGRHAHGWLLLVEELLLHQCLIALVRFKPTCLGPYFRTCV